MKYTNMDITALADSIADEKAYDRQKGHRDPASPAWIFRDERNQDEPSDILWGRELALDFEEWKAKQEQREQYLLGKLLPAFCVTTRKEIPCQPVPEDKPDPVFSRKVGKWEETTEIVLATMSEIEEWMDKPTKDKKPVMVKRTEDGDLIEWSPEAPAETLAYLDRQENREFCNWLVGWHKRRPKDNDHWRRFVLPLAGVLDDKALGMTAQTILKVMRDTLPFAPGPAKETVFINPDKSRVVTKLSPGTAKAGFIQRHNIEGELVTMDRVQYEGERTSRYVIGTRKASDKTASNYYDPDPIKGDRGYIPRACTLIRIPESKVMPDEHCYRLTIRELERAIIAGANLCEDELEAYAASFEDAETAPFDTREAGLSFDDTCDFRTMEALSEQEQWLYWTLFGAGLEEACQAMLVRRPGNIDRYLPGIDGAMAKIGTDEPLTDDEELAMGLLMNAKEEDDVELELTKRIQWSRFDFLRTLHQQERQGARGRVADLSPEALATYGGEPHAIDQLNFGAPFQHQVPGTGRKYRYTKWK